MPDTYRDVQQVEDTFAKAYRSFYLNPGYVSRQAYKMVTDPKIARQIAKGAVTLLDQFRPEVLNPALKERR